jgi:cytochrome c oxidase subunit IV
MSTHGAADAHDGHGHGHGPAGEHVPHVLPMKIYFATWAALMFLTVVTVGASYLELGTTLNLIIAMLIATIKASTVAALFMHLKYDNKFHAVIFASSLLFLGIFIGYTLSDTAFRGEADAVEHARPEAIDQPFAGTRDEAALRESIEKGGYSLKPGAEMTPPGVTPAPVPGAAPVSTPPNPVSPDLIEPNRPSPPTGQPASRPDTGAPGAPTPGGGTGSAPVTAPVTTPASAPVSR